VGDQRQYFSRSFKMKKLIVLLFSICTFQKTYSQTKGVYIGLYALENLVYPITSHEDSIEDGKKTTKILFEKIEQYGKKKLTLFNNGHYYFEYTGGCYAFSANQQQRSCKGQYKVTGDTLFLTSTYRQSDFYTVFEKVIDTIPTGKIMIITNLSIMKPQPGTSFTWFNLQLNDTSMGDFKINDTIYCKSNEVKKFFFRSCSPQEMEWSYIPQNTKTNCFNVTLSRDINGENIFMNQEKFLIRKKRLVLLSGSKYLNVKDGLYKKD
jgi:hypothetical protein